MSSYLVAMNAKPNQHLIENDRTAGDSGSPQGGAQRRRYDVWSLCCDDRELCRVPRWGHICVCCPPL